MASPGKLELDSIEAVPKDQVGQCHATHQTHMDNDMQVIFFACGHTARMRCASLYHVRIAWLLFQVIGFCAWEMLSTA